MSVRSIEFHIIKTNTSFFFCLANMNRLNVFFDNIMNFLVIKDKKMIMSVIRRFEHAFLLWKNVLRIYIIDSFNENSCYLIETKLRQLHRQFDHSSVKRLYKVLKRSNHANDDEMNEKTLIKLIKFCSFCQKHAK